MGRLRHPILPEITKITTLVMKTTPEVPVETLKATETDGRITTGKAMVKLF